MVDDLVGTLGVLDPELRCPLLVLLALVFAQFAVGLTHAVLDMLRTSRDVFCTQRAVLDLLFVLFLNTAYLVDVDTALHQLGDNLLARYATGILLHNVVHYLIVGHSRLSPSHGDCQHETGYHCSYSFHNNAYIFIIKNTLWREILHKSTHFFRKTSLSSKKIVKCLWSVTKYFVPLRRKYVTILGVDWI